MLLQHIDHERGSVVGHRRALHAQTAAFLASLGSKWAARMRDAARKVAKAGPEDEESRRLELSASGWAADDWRDYEETARPHLEAVAKDGGNAALEQVGVTGDELPAALQQVNTRAVKWAAKHAAELVKEVSRTTRERVNALVVQGLEDGLSNDAIADLLVEDPAFSDARAETIARTETAHADTQGNLLGWRESGAVAGKEWMTSQEDPCPECAALDGQVVPLDDGFPGGDPPLHPRCECALLPVLEEPR